MSQALANTRRNLVMHGALGAYFYREGRLPEAEAQFRDALKIKPESAGILANLSATLGRSGNYDEAIVLLQKSLRLKPNEPGNHNNLGIFYIGIGKTEEAIREFTEAIRLKPDYPQAKGNLATAIAKRSAQSLPPAPVDSPVESKAP
jgi:Flp pilus assembly protein TadD